MNDNEWGDEAGSFVVPSRDGDPWIKKPQDGNTRVRLLQPLKSFVTYREHFVDGPGFFMCGTDKKKPCPGCSAPTEKERRQTRVYAFNCLDTQGHMQILKIGSDLWGRLRDKEQRDSTLLDRDWVLIRAGSGLETKYDYDPGERYVLEDAPAAIYNINNVIARNYYDAIEALGVEVTEEQRERVAEVWMPGYLMTGPEAVYDSYENGGWPRCSEEDFLAEIESKDNQVSEPEPPKAKPTKAAKAPAKAAKAAPVSDEAQTGSEFGDEAGAANNAPTGHVPDPDDPETWISADLREFLKERRVEFPDRAPQSRLVLLVKEHWDDAPF